MNRVIRLGKLVKQQDSFSEELGKLTEKKELSKDSVKRMIAMIKDSKCSALDMLSFIDETRKQFLSPKERINLGRLMIAWHYAVHGSKSQSLNIDVKTQKMSVEDINRIIREGQEAKDKLKVEDSEIEEAEYQMSEK